jgi:serine/threonine protein phosphatase PrpC
VTSTGADLCSFCAGPVVAGDRFCEVCGRAVSYAPVAEPPAPAEPAASLAACPACGEDRMPTDDGYCGVCGMRAPVPGDHVEAAFDGAAAVSDKGRRPENQDAFALWVEPQRPAIAVVCDGVSTTASPGEAARRAADAALRALRAASAAQIPDVALRAAHVAASEAVSRLASESGADGAGPPSCTLLAALVVEDHVYVMSVGDCRASWLPVHGEPMTLTEDDSWAAEQIATGGMTPEAAYGDPRSHGITRWIGDDADPCWEPRRTELVARSSGRLLLCSDGLWNYATTAPALVVATGEGDPLSVARRLVDFATEKGGHDNITVVVVDLPRQAGDEGDHVPTGGTP